MGTESGIINRNFNEEILFGKKDESVKNSNDESFKTTEHRYFYEDYAAAGLSAKESSALAIAAAKEKRIAR
jgi:hypothetical protein